MYLGKLLKWVLTIGLCCALPVGAQTTWPAGEYMSDGGWGRLQLEPAAQGKQMFSLDTLGVNGHSCSLGGEISSGRAVLKEAENNSACIIRFTGKNGYIQVKPELNDACRYYCGMRAGFDGSYKKPAVGCDSASLKKTRAIFQQQYDRKNYAAAERTLAPVLQRCQRTLFEPVELDIRNDLALTQAKLGKGAACRQTLKPLAADAALYSGDETRDQDAICHKGDRLLPPSDCYSYLHAVRAAKTNLKWCARAGK